MKRDQTIYEKTSQGYNQQNSVHEKLNMTKNLIYSTTKMTSSAEKKTEQVEPKYCKRIKIHSNRL